MQKKNKRVVVANWEASKKYCVRSQQRVEKQKLPEPKISSESTKKTKSKITQVIYLTINEMDVGIKGQLLQYLGQLESSRVLPKKMTTKMIKWCVK